MTFARLLLYSLLLGPASSSTSARSLRRALAPTRPPLEGLDNDILSYDEKPSTELLGSLAIGLRGLRGTCAAAAAGACLGASIVGHRSWVSGALQRFSVTKPLTEAGNLAECEPLPDEGSLGDGATSGAYASSSEDTEYPLKLSELRTPCYVVDWEV